MAYRINCGKPERNEVEALNRLAAELPDSWALFTNVPRHLTGHGSKGREIDALALSPLGAVVIELKHFGGLITVSPAGEWFVTGKLLTDHDGNPQFPLQQAGRAAQVLKSAMGAAARSVYIEACAVATRPGASIRFSDPSRPHPVMAMDDVIDGIEALARRTRGVSYPALKAFFDLVGHGIPSKLDSRWQASASAKNRSAHRTQGRPQSTHGGRRFHNSPRMGRREQANPFLLWLVLAVIAGSLLGWISLQFVAPG
ncbi:nuclease-related domain-containing protein [Novosphingobium sp.]|uniref:nuclease-related domain-containing protein n=1 Tax=Novosphingobium sp. TaxID=1874826 RepID=UPI00286D3DF5|nr:nuclease-related domain-containing protein [Novosphingobium sp.]